MRPLNKQIQNWCVNALNPYGFPDKPWKIKKGIIIQTYCKNYPYLPIENPFSTRNNFESRYIRHKEIKKIFSPRQNITLYFAGIHVILFKLFIEQRLNSVKQITDSIKAIFISIGVFRLITWIISLFS